MKWISVKDRLPEDYQDIIIYIPIYMGMKDFCVVSTYVSPESLERVTHWMSLPEPPVNEE